MTQARPLPIAALTRRHFLAMVSAGAAAAAAFPAAAVAAPAGPIRVGLIGGDSDGISLLARALRADRGFRLVAIADEVDARARRALDIFTHHRRRGGPHPQVEVGPGKVLAGADAAERLCAVEALDAVFVAGIPAYRSGHVSAAIAAGKHVFMLGPGAVDAVGCRALLGAADRAEAAGLSIGVDLATTAASLSSAAGIDVRWQRAPWRRFTPGGSAAQNWYFDEDLSGGVLLGDGFGVIDRINQLKGGPPLLGVGRLGDGPGEHAVAYRYPDGSLVTMRFHLGKGLASRFEARLTDGSPLPPSSGDGTEAIGAFLEAIRSGRPDGWRPRLDRLVAATRTALLGREAARLGRPLDWAEIA